ncbi:hypothetical protein B188_18160 [Candidatus Brocadiaceae bacterium B188]|nr:hypothetical protein [Candidatus Brocadia sapporoensis]QQR66859.1 MAG: hypothetical protein IPI25_00915 [Candidatus Brocadia sp.]RZV57865.1 MAG: hypothetical protein EX330_08295 [Candidatus Brocadia sp. BROELEC01]TWU53834.1 hypothetical protein B188_18160 [Candidatus Brocadiaceae bacterium B188]
MESQISGERLKLERHLAKARDKHGSHEEARTLVLPKKCLHGGACVPITHVRRDSHPQLMVRRYYHFQRYMKSSFQR